MFFLRTFLSPLFFCLITVFVAMYFSYKIGIFEDIPYRVSVIIGWTSAITGLAIGVYFSYKFL